MSATPIAVNVDFSLVIPPGSRSHLSLTTEESIAKKELTGTDHTSHGRLPIDAHFKRLTKSGHLKPGDTVLALSVRNVMANLRCFGYVRNITEAPVGVVEDALKSQRPVYALIGCANGSHAIDELELNSIPEDCRWFVSGVPVLWDKSSETALFERIVTEAADHSHVWHIPRGNHPDATDNSRKKWSELQEIFVAHLEDDRKTAFKALTEAAGNLERESNIIHNVIGLRDDGSLVQVIGTGMFEELGQRARMLGASRAICVDNSGSSVVQFSPKGKGFVQLVAAPNHRPAGTAYLFFQLKSDVFKIESGTRDSNAVAPRYASLCSREGISQDDLEEVSRLCVVVTGSGGKPEPLGIAADSGDLAPFQGSVCEKALSEIDDAIRHLSVRSAATLPGAPEHKFVFHPLAKLRTITLLVGLKHFLQEIKDGDDGFPFEVTIPLRANTTAFEGTNQPGLEISQLLLLVHAVKYAQIAWPLEYQYEYRGAERAAKAMRVFLGRVLKANPSPDKGNPNPADRAANALFHLIRWQTLDGQFFRDSASFSVSHLDGIANIVPTPFAKAVAWADSFLRCSLAANEAKVEEILRGENPESKLLLRTFGAELAENVTKDRPNGVNNPKAFWKFELAQDAHSDLRIRSYGRYQGGEAHAFFPDDVAAGSEKTILHHSYLRTQAVMGLNSTAEFQIRPHEYDNLIRTYCPKDIDYREWGLEYDERVYVTTIHPAFLANKKYGLQLDLRGEGERVVLEPVDRVMYFLSDCFEGTTTAEQFGGRLPFPMVSRLLDLCSAFNEYVRNEHDDSTGTITSMPVLRTTFEFDTGTPRAALFDIYLPNIRDEDHYNSLRVRLSDIHVNSVTERITRFLCAFVTNYGMLANWRTLDMDFSASAQERSFWSERIEEGMKRLGLHVFHRYLENAAGTVLSTSRSRLQFHQVLDEQTVNQPVLLERPSEDYDDTLTAKYALGIDIGGTAVKLQFFSIEKESSSDRSRGLARVAKTTDAEIVLSHHGSSYSIPTRRSAAAGSDKPEFSDARDFTKYILGQLVARMRRKGIADIKELLRQTIVVSLTWPGPIIDNHIAGVSGILKLFRREGDRPFTGGIMADPIDRVREIDLASALREEFSALVASEAESSAKRLSVALINDGDADALGTYVSKIKKHKGWVDGFSRHAVAIAKAGTGTAGAVIVNGTLFGLNEFGKLILDLNADNSQNEKQVDPDKAWPVGDANKFFSMRFLKGEATRLGADGQQIEGRDLEILLSPKEDSAKKIELGALDLCLLAAPNIEYHAALEHKDWTLKYSSDIGFELVQGRSIDPLDDITVHKLATHESLVGCGIHIGSVINLEELLNRLGDNRWARLQLPNLNDNATELGRLGERMGDRFADLVALLYDFYGIRTLIMAGGPVSGDHLGTACFKQMNKAVEVYLTDRYHVGHPSNPDKFRQVCAEWADHHTDPVASKLWTVHEKSSFPGMLGAAVRGVYQYFEDRKIQELQLLKREPDRERELKFVTKDELKRARASFESLGRRGLP